VRLEEGERKANGAIRHTNPKRLRERRQSATPRAEPELRADSSEFNCQRTNLPPHSTPQVVEMSIGVVHKFLRTVRIRATPRAGSVSDGRGTRRAGSVSDGLGTRRAGSVSDGHSFPRPSEPRPACPPAAGHLTTSEKVSFAYILATVGQSSSSQPDTSYAGKVLLVNLGFDSKAQFHTFNAEEINASNGLLRQSLVHFRS
jgi:hypothetical protein